MIATLTLVLLLIVTLSHQTVLSLGLSSRRVFFSHSTNGAATIMIGTTAISYRPLSVQAAPEIYSTPNGVKYAILKSGKGKKSVIDGDLVAIEYTGYLTDGRIFDASHAEGKSNALLFKLGGNAVIDGINEVIKEMAVGEKVQAIVPPELAFRDKGLCLENGECLIKPKATLVYDIYLKAASIPPP
jgi:hypothetical protein